MAFYSVIKNIGAVYFICKKYLNLNKNVSLLNYLYHKGISLSQMSQCQFLILLNQAVFSKTQDFAIAALYVFIRLCCISISLVS